MKHKFSKEQIKVCLSCKKCHQIIGDYYELHKIKRKDGISNEDFEENLQKEEQNIVIEDLAKKLDIEGNLVEQYNLLKNLSDDLKVKENATFCLENLNIILHALKGFFYYENGNNDAIFEKYKNVIPVLNLINEMNNEFNTDTKYMYRENKDCIKKLNENTLDDMSDKTKLYIRNSLLNVMETYNFSKDINFRFDDGQNCGAYNFLEWVKAQDVDYYRMRKVFFERVNMLPKTKKTIALNFLKFAPKNFSYNLRKVMDIQGMTENDICKIIGKHILPISSLQSLMTSKIPKQEDFKIEYLARTLLVSTDVLYIGYGKRYGNWKDLLSDDNVSYIKSQELGRYVRTNNETKDFVRKNIQELITQSEEEYMYMINEVSDLFCEEEFSVYENEIEIFDAILHHKELMVLIDVLVKDE